MTIDKNSLTWCHVSEPNGGHGDEAEVEGVEKRPVLNKKTEQLLVRMKHNVR